MANIEHRRRRMRFAGWGCAIVLVVGCTPLDEDAKKVNRILGRDRDAGSGATRDRDAGTGASPDSGAGEPAALDAADDAPRGDASAGHASPQDDADPIDDGSSDESAENDDQAGAEVDASVSDGGSPDGGDSADAGPCSVDACGVCDHDADNDNTTCVRDCAGAWGGDATEDDCGVCDDDAGNDNTTCVRDCAGAWGGDATEDDCGVCDDNAGNDNTTCVQDCAGVWGGDAVLDLCGQCDSDPSNDEDCCTPAAYEACHEGNLWSFDACDRIEVLSQTCDDGCADDACLTDNADPVAQDDDVDGWMNTPITFDVVANDTDPNGDALTVTAVADAEKGVVELAGAGRVTFTPSDDYAGAASFTYTASDGRGGSDTATVTLDINVSPWTRLATALSTTTSSGWGPKGIALGDINRDGKLDIVVADNNYNAASSVLVFLNTTPSIGATPRFDSAAAFDSGTDTEDVVLVDLDGDEDLDVVGSNQYDIGVLLNTTAEGADAPSFEAVESFGGAYCCMLGLDTADFNTDGRPDVVGVSYNNNAYDAYLNATAGTPVPTLAFETVVPTYTLGGQPWAVAAGDLDGDGRPDLAVSNAGNTGSPSVGLLRNLTAQGATAVSFSGAAVTMADSTRGIAMADVNGDGRLDVLAGVAGEVAVLLNETGAGDTTITMAQVQAQPAGLSIYHVTRADLDLDGRPDVVATNSSSSSADSALQVLYNRTPKDAKRARFVPALPLPTGTFPWESAVGDLNGDGEPDLVSADYHGRSVTIFTSDGSY